MTGGSERPDSFTFDQMPDTRGVVAGRDAESLSFSIDLYTGDQVGVVALSMQHISNGPRQHQHLTPNTGFAAAHSEQSPVRSESQ